MNEQQRIIEEVEEMYRLSDLAVHAILSRFIKLETDEQTSDEL